MIHQDKTIRLTLIAAAIFLFILVTRFVGLGKFVTVDEPAWTLFASNFYLALSRGQFEKTAIDYGVTTLWILTLAFLSYFPGYRLVAKYTDKYWRVDELLHKYHKLPLTLLVRGRLISILLISGFLVIAFLLLNMLTGLVTSLVVVFMIVLDPFFLGHSRLLNHEGLMATGILIAILAVLVYLYKRSQVRYLVISGAATGIALLAKVPAIVLFPLVGLMFLVSLLEGWRSNTQRGRTLLRYFGGLALWAVVVVSVYTLLWPGMWVDPGAMMYEVFGNALSNALQGGRLASTQGLRPESYGLDTSGIVYFIKLVILKTSPVVWLGCILAIVGLWVRKRYPMTPICKKIVAYFGLLAILFVVMFGLAQGRNHNHYILTSFVGLDVIAGIGLAWGYGWLAEKVPVFQKRWVATALFAALLGLHVIGGLGQYPYYYTYTNPLAQALLPGYRDPDAGYGEGLELAGAYLAAKPGASDLKAMSWYAAGPFSYFFPGTTYNLLISENVDKTYVERMKQSDYLVIYSVQQKAVNMPAKLLEALQSITPEKVIQFNGREYVQIYRVKDFPATFFESIKN